LGMAMDKEEPNGLTSSVSSSGSKLIPELI